MVSSTELRIGNYINDAFNGRVEVRGVTKGGIWIRNEGFPGSENMFSPIPITPEYLNLIGFKEYERRDTSHFRNFYTEDKYGLALALIGDEYYAKDSWSCLLTDRNIKYVHEIQNMYFAITGGKELRVIDIKIGELATWKFGYATREVKRISEDEYLVHDMPGRQYTAIAKKEQLPGLLSGNIDLLSLDWV